MRSWRPWWKLLLKYMTLLISTSQPNPLKRHLNWVWISFRHCDLIADFTPWSACCETSGFLHLGLAGIYVWGQSWLWVWSIMSGVSSLAIWRALNANSHYTGTRMDSEILVASQAASLPVRQLGQPATNAAWSSYLELNNWHRYKCLLTCIWCPHLNFNSFIMLCGALF